MSASSKVSESQCIDQLRLLVASTYMPDSPTHDLTHLARVASLGDQLCTAEGGNRLVVVSAAWLHDLHREARPADSSFFISPEQEDERAIVYLAKVGIPEKLHADIIEAIHYTDRFSFSDRPTYPTTIEARVLRDADCLDAIGAIGVARAFAFGGAHGIPLGDQAVFEARPVYEQSVRPPSTIQHFYDKLLRLSGDLETTAARVIAKQRSEYLEGFVAQFIAEWRQDMTGLA